MKPWTIACVLAGVLSACAGSPAAAPYRLGDEARQASLVTPAWLTPPPLWSTATTESSGPQVGGEAVDPPTASGVLPSANLVSSCLAWLETPLTPSHHVRLSNGLAQGSPAVDFALRDVKGRTHTLSDLLDTRPVLLVLGAFT